MTLASWRSPLARALHRNRSLVYARYLQLATVRGDGRPANRTVVFRGFLEDTNQLKFVTDARSEKIEQIAQVPYGEACWYFPKTREQFRLSGKLILVTHDSVDPSLQTARQRSWQDLSDAARTQFVWSDSDKPTDEDDEAAIDPQILSPTMPLSQFCMLLLDPTQVDHLELRGNPQIRSIYSFSHSIGWSMQAVNANR